MNAPISTISRGGVTKAAPAKTPNSLFKDAWVWADNEDALEIDLDKAKPIAKGMVNVQRDEAKHLAFNVPGLGDFSADEESAKNIAGAVQMATLALSTSSPFSIEWSLDNDDPITLDASQMVAVGQALSAHVNSAYVSARAKRSQIDAATTVNEIMSIAGVAQ